MTYTEWEEADWFDWEADRQCSYPCHICGEEDEIEDED